MQKQKHWFFIVSFIQGEEINVHPWYLMLPAAISSSFTFMLRIATPPNTIVFADGHLKVKDMVCNIDCNQRGFLLTTHWNNWFGVALIHYSSNQNKANGSWDGLS